MQQDEDGSQIPKIGQFADAQITRDQIARDQAHRDTNPLDNATPEGAVGGAGAPQGAVEGAGAPNGDLDMTRWMKAQMEVQTDVFLKAIAALTATQGAATAKGQAAPEAAQGVQMAQNTQALSLTTPVLFYGRCKDGKSIPPNAFLMELEARQTRHGWEGHMIHLERIHLESKLDLPRKCFYRT
jgi:hypothetical protein